MIERQISVDLPPPWSGGTFDAEEVGPINALVAGARNPRDRHLMEVPV